MNKYVLKISLSFWFICISTHVLALEFALPNYGDVVGEVKEAYSIPGETLGDVGRRFDIGYFEMLEANPQVNPDHVLTPGTKLIIPSLFILPPGPRAGIIVNLAELRLYYYPPDRKVVITKPVGIGREGWKTPLGRTKVIAKTQDPYWYPTQSVREDAERLGHTLPTAVPPGPDNPLGKYAMRLGWREYLIHGTNKPEGVGRRSSAGCIRMFPEDIEILYNLIKIGTQVTIVNEPYKIGWLNNQLYFEAHQPLQEDQLLYKEDMTMFVDRVHKLLEKRKGIVQWSNAQLGIIEQTGIPVKIGESY